MGATSETKKMSSVMSSLKNLPNRFRSKAQLPLDKNGGDATPIIGSRKLKQHQQEEEELQTETDTVAPSKNEKALNPKLVVRATQSSAVTNDSSSEYSDPASAPHLVYMTSYGGNMNYPLTRAETHIGRKDDNHIILTDATISKFHAIIFRKNDTYSFID